MVEKSNVLYFVPKEETEPELQKKKREKLAKIEGDTYYIHSPVHGRAYMLLKADSEIIRKLLDEVLMAFSNRAVEHEAEKKEKTDGRDFE